MLGWSFKLEGEVFDGVKIITAGHMNMEKKILNPDGRVCCSIICLYVYGFQSLWEFIVQDLIGET